MRAIRYYLIILAVASVVIALWVIGDSRGAAVGPGYWGSLFLNISAGLFCLALGSFLALEIASRTARAKLDLLAKPFVNLVAELRLGKTITQEAARYFVICTVGLIAEDHLRKLRGSDEEVKGNCTVCGLGIKLNEDKSGCGYCGLGKHLWCLGETQAQVSQVEGVK